MRCTDLQEKWGCMMNKLKNYYLELAGRVCTGVKPEHYNRWYKWAKEQGMTISPWIFIASLTGLRNDKVSDHIFPWHMAQGKRVDDEYEKIILHGEQK